MIVDCISDMHGEFPEMSGGDLLIVAGDCTSNDSVKAWKNYFQWFESLDYKKKVMIAGNHDNFCQSWAKDSDSIYDLVERPFFTYLCDSGTEFEFEEDVKLDIEESDDGPDNFKSSMTFKLKRKFKIWGSPWTAQFEGINPKCCAFTEYWGCDTDDWLSEHWQQIPSDTDILITHCPPYGILDKITPRVRPRFEQMLHAGSQSLTNIVLSSEKMPNLKLMVFGHIHEAYGEFSTTLTKFVNASHMNEQYFPVNKPIRVIL